MPLASRSVHGGRAEAATRLGRVCAGIIEAAWLIALATTPLFVNVYSHRSFEPDKTALLRLLTIVMVAAWLAKLAFGRREGRGLADDDPARMWRWPVLAPVCLMGLGLLVSSLMSIDPRLSWDGSYSRAQGTWAQLAYLTIFIAMLAHLRRAEQTRRLVFVVVLTSLPAALYGIFQHLGQDPVQWQLPYDRVGSTLGNPVFFAAYLVMALFITLEALWRHRSTAIRAGALLYVTVMQVAALGVAQSRGPTLGLLAGFITVVVLIPSLRQRAGRHRRRSKQYQAALVVVGLVLLVLSIAGSSSSRLADLLDPTSPSARVRLLIWLGAADIVTADQPLISSDGEADRWHRWRPWIGFGPETFALMFHRFHSPELARLERPDSTPDRAHNIVLDLLVTVGAVGLIAWLWLIGGLFFLALRSFRRSPGGDETSQCRQQNHLTLALVAALVAHIVELQFSFLVATSALYFWAFAALLVANSQGWLGWKSSAEDRPSFKPNPFLGLREGSVAGLLTAAVAGPWIYLALASRSHVDFAQALSEKAAAGDGLQVLGLVLITLVAVALVPITSTATASTRRRALWTGFTLAYLGPLTVYATAHGVRLHHVSLALGAGDELLGISRDVAGTFPAFAVWLLGLVLSVGVALGFRWHSPTPSRQPKLWARQPILATLVICATAAAMAWQILMPPRSIMLQPMLLRPIHADTLLKHGEAFRAGGRPDLALELFDEAISIAPNEPRILQARAAAALDRARSTTRFTAPTMTRESLLARAETDLERAHELTPLDPGNSANLARFLIAKGQMAADTSQRDAAYRRASDAYREALLLRPRSVVLLGERAALAQHRGDSQQARELLQQALELDPEALHAFRRAQLARDLTLP